MSPSNSTLAEIASINYIGLIVTQLWFYMLICLGTIGHSLNIYIFTRPTLRSNPCVCFFLASSISGFLVTYINIPIRLLQQVYYIDAFGYSNASCKIFSFIVLWTKGITSWFIAFACIDRFLSSSRSAGIRKWSDVRVASRTIPIMMLVYALFYIYIPIYYQIQNGIFGCPENQGPYLFFHGIWNLIIFSLGPSVVMLAFGSLTIRNVRQTVKRIAHQDMQNQPQTQLSSPRQRQPQREKMIDRQLIRMILVQCIYFSLLSTPISINYIYSALRINVVTDALESAKYNFFSKIVGLLSITSACTSFYLFTLSSPLFRQKLMHLFKSQRQSNRETLENTQGGTERK